MRRSETPLMSTKIAIIIAVELGLSLAIMGWLVFVRLPAAGPAGVAALSERPADSSAELRQRSERRLTVAEDLVNLVATEQGAPGPQAAQEYEEVLQEPYYTYAGNDLVVDSEPYYSREIEQPIVAQSPFILALPVQIFQSVQTSQIIIYANNRPHRPRRCVMPPPNGATPTTTVSHRPGGGQPRTRGGAANPRPNPGPPLADVPRSTAKARNSGPRQLVVTQQHR